MLADIDADRRNDDSFSNEQALAWLADDTQILSRRIEQSTALWDGDCDVG